MKLFGFGFLEIFGFDQEHVATHQAKLFPASHQ